MLFTFKGHVGPVYAVAFTLDEYSVVSGGADSAILMWDLGGLLRDDPASLAEDRPELTRRLMGLPPVKS